MTRCVGVVLTAAVLVTGAKASEKITVKGSDTMVILAQRWAEEYMKKNQDVVIQVTGGGTGTGISALINGTTDICNASRPMKDSERQKIQEKYGARGVEIRTALDGVAIYLNEKNPIKELTLGQIKDIYTGKITSWKQVGGADKRIILYSRENNSGTYVYFKDEVLMGEDFTATAQNMPGTAAVVNAISKDPWGIGYGGSAYGRGIREIPVRKDADSPAYAPTMDNIRGGKYPISRFLFMYVVRKPEGALKAYIDWILGDEGQKLVAEVGYFPIR